jgi:hypothetical protein
MWTGAVLACTGILLAGGSPQPANLDGEPRHLDLGLSSTSASAAAPAPAGQITPLAIPRGSPLPPRGSLDASPLDPTGPGPVIEAFGHVSLRAARVANRGLIVSRSRDVSINAAPRPPPPLPFINTAAAIHCGAMPTTDLIDIASDPTFANARDVVTSGINSFGADVPILSVADVRSRFWMYRASAAVRTASGLSRRQPRSPYRERPEAT